jgi:molybdate transport system substrate-binding protein
MKFTKPLIIICTLVLVSFATAASAQNTVLAAAAGYKKMVNALNTAYKQDTGKSIDLLFGNMTRVTALANQSGKVDIVLGDKFFLTKSKLSMSTRQKLGQGILVLAFAKSGHFSSINDLDSDKVYRIALPDPQKTIYGKAAREFLQSSGRLPDIQPKLLEVSTIPQVFSYLAIDEVDLGFMNLTHALNVADKIGGYVIVDEKSYSNIEILAGLLSNSQNMDQAKDFLHFLKTPKAQTIIRENGL